MRRKLDLLGAIVAHVVFVASILTFASRLALQPGLGSWFGLPILLMAFPLGYLLLRAPGFKRPRLYYVQIGAMLVWLAVLFVLDYVLRYDFRQTPWMVISFVVLYFAGLGGMLGIASLAGRRWMLSAIVLFLVAGALAFVQRAATGL
jgi:hypothetical protein